jgi:predicted PurR-regulated permease PerM
LKTIIFAAGMGNRLGKFTQNNTKCMVKVNDKKLVEYTLVFFLIGHPDYLLLGILSAITTIIPYFGGIITNIIAVITAAVINTKLLVLTIIVALILPNTDGNIVSPKIFSKTNNVPALLTIFAVFAGGVLYGVTGIILSLPVTIILLTTFRFYRKDIYDKIGSMKRMK